MRYLTLSADYLQPSLRDDKQGAMAVHQAGLSEELAVRIVAWNAEYQIVIPRGLEERRALADLIEVLDASGAALAREVERELAPAKVRYYSEGWMRHRCTPLGGHSSP